MFKKGQSGNPNGRPKLSEALATEVRELLDLKYKESDKSNRRVMIEKAIQEAINGNQGFFDKIMDRAYGKAPQQTDITTDGESLNQELSIVFKEIANKSRNNE